MLPIQSSTCFPLNWEIFPIPTGKCFFFSTGKSFLFPLRNISPSFRNTLPFMLWLWDLFHSNGEMFPIGRISNSYFQWEIIHLCIFPTLICHKVFLTLPVSFLQFETKSLNPSGRNSSWKGWKRELFPDEYPESLKNIHPWTLNNF